MKYMKFVNGKGLQVVKDVDEACDDFTTNIKELFHAEKRRNDRLQAENEIGRASCRERVCLSV